MILSEEYKKRIKELAGLTSLCENEISEQEKFNFVKTVFAIAEPKTAKAVRLMLEKYPDVFQDRYKTCLKYIIGDLPKNYNGHLNFYGINKLPNNIKFENKGYVNLYSLTTLPDNIKFENKGWVDLSSLTTLPNNVKFENKGWVDLGSLTTLPNNVKFKN